MSDSSSSPSAVPPFRLLFPSGWSRYTPSEQDERALLDRVRQRMKSIHRPDMNVELNRYVRQAFADLRRKDAIAMYLPSEVEGDGWPMSMTASILRDPTGQPLDARLATVIREGGEFLDAERTILRWAIENPSVDEVPGLSARQIAYAIPIPGSRRTRALLFSTTIIADPQAPAEGDGAEAYSMLSDLSDRIIGTFRWHGASSASS